MAGIAICRGGRVPNKGNRIPTFIVPGDNEVERVRLTRIVVGVVVETLSEIRPTMEISAPVTRQSGRPENFAFVLDRVLFIGINKVEDACTIRRNGGLDWRDDGRWSC